VSNLCVCHYSSSLIISESLGLFGLSNPCISPYSTSLIIFESLGLSNPCVSRDCSSLLISEALGLFGPSNTWVFRYSTSLIISETLGAVWAVESIGLPLQHFVDYFCVPTALVCEIHGSPVTALRCLFLSP